MFKMWENNVENFEAERMCGVMSEELEELSEKIAFAIKLIGGKGSFECGLRYALRWCLSLIDGIDHEFEKCERKDKNDRQ